MTEQLDIPGINPTANLPIGMTPGYRRALERAEGVCEHLSKPRRAQDAPQRCSRSVNGGYRLLLWGEALLCDKHWSAARLEARKK
jgi:hypothetical protein